MQPPLLPSPPLPDSGDLGNGGLVTTLHPYLPHRSQGLGLQFYGRRPGHLAERWGRWGGGLPELSCTPGSLVEPALAMQSPPQTHPPSCMILHPISGYPFSGMSRNEVQDHAGGGWVWVPSITLGWGDRVSFGPPPHLHARDMRCREGWARNPGLKLVTLNFLSR